MKNVVLLLGVIVTVVLVSALGGWWSADAQIPPDARASSAAEPPFEARALLPTAADVERVRVPAVEQPRVERAVDRRSGPVGTSFDVLVVDARTREPVAGARVLFLDQPLPVVLSRAASLQRDGEPPVTGRLQLFERFGESVVTGAHGRARVVGSAWSHECVAIAGARFGRPSGARQDGALVIAIAGRGLDVRVLGIDGRAVTGAHVMSSCVAGEATDAHYPALLGRSDATGVLRVTSLEPFVPRWRRLADGGWQTELFVDVFGAVSESVSLRSDTIPSEPLLLRAPPSGRVEIATVGASGEARPVRGYVEIEPVGGTGGTDGSAAEVSVSERRKVAVTRGRAVLGAVAVGGQWRVRVHVGDSVAEHEFSGPARAGEAVVVPVRLDLPSVTLRGAAVDTLGEQIVGPLLVGASVERELGGPRVRGAGSLGEDGTFSIRLDVARDDVDWETLVLTVARPDELMVAWPDGVVWADPVVTDLGSVTFDAGAEFAAGTVVDGRDGTVVAGASIHVQVPLVEWASGETKWRDSAEVRIVADGGQFRLLGHPDPSTRLLAHASGYRTAIVEPERLSGFELEIVLEPAANLRVRIRGPVDGRLVQLLGTSHGRFGRSAIDLVDVKPSGDGAREVEWRDVEAGVRTLQVIDRHGGVVVTRDVVLEPQAPTEIIDLELSVASQAAVPPLSGR